MNSLTRAIAIGAAVATVGSAAHAVTSITLTENSGWHYGESHAANSTKMYSFDGSGGQFTLSAVVTQPLDDLSFVDGYVPGDVYAVSIKSGGGTVSYKTQFLDGTFYNEIPDLNGGPFGSTFGPDWLVSSYGHMQAQLSPGVYTITVKDLCGSRGVPACPGFPAGWGIRLDSAVPEPSSWAFMILGAVGLGASMRRRRASAAA